MREAMGNNYYEPMSDQERYDMYMNMSHEQLVRMKIEEERHMRLKEKEEIKKRVYLEDKQMRLYGK